MKKTKRYSQSGFTLIEIMLVVVIIGILMSIVMVKYGGQQEKARVNAAKADIRMYSTALGLFELDNGSYPTTEQGLPALITQPSNTTAWKGPYIESNTLRNDPWGNPYIYKFPGEKRAFSYDLYSFGPNKVEGGDDDIGNWQ